MKSTLCFLNNGPFRILFNVHLLTVWNRQEWNTEFNIDPSQSTVSAQPIISTNAQPEWLQSQNTGQTKPNQTIWKQVNNDLISSHRGFSWKFIVVSYRRWNCYYLVPCVSQTAHTYIYKKRKQNSNYIK